jgi:hypothetical protein
MAVSGMGIPGPLYFEMVVRYFMESLSEDSIPALCEPKLLSESSEFKIPGIDNTDLILSAESESHFSNGSSFLPVKIVIAIGVSFVDFATTIVPILRINPMVWITSLL